MQADLPPPSLIPPTRPPLEAPYIPRHFQPEDIGMEPGIGGMGRADYQTWKPSNVLMNEALQGMSPAIQKAFRNRKINRPTLQPPDWNGNPAWGAYDRDGDIHISRQAADYPGTPYGELPMARHELLHGVSMEMQPYQTDLAAGLPILLDALKQSQWRYPPDMLTADPYHFWTGAAESVMSQRPWEISPQLRAYFSDLLGGR